MRVRTAVGIVLLVLAAGALGWWLGTQREPTPSAARAAEGGPCAGGAAPLYWKAPMDPSYVRDEPGKSPMGMDLVPVCPGEESGGPGIRVDPTVVQSIGVETALVERRDLTRQIRAVGRVDYDERLVAHVHTKVQGWVEDLYVEYAGEAVSRGQPLLEIYAPELVSTQEEVLLAARYRDTMERSEVEDVAEGGRALYRAARRRLELFDIPERDIERLLRTGAVRKTLTLYAPVGGVVTHLMVREGMEVAPNQNLYTIANLSDVWLYVDIYEYELPWVEEGQHATARLSYLPNEVFHGTVTYVYPYLDPKTRTARVRVELENREGILKPDMYANVTLEAERHEDALAVPDEAVMRSGKRSLAIVALGEGRFEPRDVETGLETGDGWVEIEEGLRAGERVVTSGQFLIDSESRLREAVQKLLAAGGEAETGASPGHEGHEMPTDDAPGDEGHEMPTDDAPGDEGHSMPEPDATAMPEGGAGEGHEGHRMPDRAAPRGD